KTKENEIKTLKSSYTKEQNKLLKEYKPLIENVKQTIQNLKDEKDKNIKEQTIIYHKKLNEKSIDTKSLEKLEKAYINLSNEIDNIEAYQEIIFGYNKDKKEYIDQIDIKTKEQKELKQKLDSLTYEFEKLDQSYKEQINTIDNSISEDKQKLQRIDFKLSNIKNFENSTTFSDCIKWGVKYIQGEEYEDIDIVLKRVDNLASRYRTYYVTIERSLAKLHNIFHNTLNIEKQLDSLETAYILKEFEQNNKIEKVKNILSQNLNQIVSTIIKEYDRLLDSQGKIESLVKKITKTFDEIKIGVIDSLALRYSTTNNKIIETFGAIKILNDENSFSYGFDTLFSSSDNSKQIIGLLKKLVDLIEFENTNSIELEDSFILEFRVVENGNDSKYVQSLDMVGSNGTDVLVKSMIYVAMLHIFKEKITKKEMMLQVVLDEVGILSQRYLKELIDFANKKGILFVNGAPDEKLIGTYKRVSLISKIDKISVVKELIVQ
ncbi:MAG: ATP-binding protein, partial [Campylobacterota bacterium]|nr:ATP-binding protein [Campylobacterota bacterium]